MPRPKPPVTSPRRPPSSVPVGQRPAFGDSDRHARAGTKNGNAKVTEKIVRAWRAEAARVLRARLRATGGVNARTGEALVHPFRGTGLFVRLARDAQPPVSVAAVSMAVHGETWGHVPGALPRYVAPAPEPVRRRGQR